MMLSPLDRDPSVSILPEIANWRSRAVRYYSGDWKAIQGLLPEFDLVPFAAGLGEPSNPFLQTVVRRPLTKTERPMPIGIVSLTYSLAPHREVADLCRRSLAEAGIPEQGLRYEVGLSELGEWMNFRIYLPDIYSYTDRGGAKLDLRLECFNSVDGSARLTVLFGWYRLVCSNGLVIGETKIEISERHGRNLDLASLSERIRPALEAVQADRSRMKAWHAKPVTMEAVAEWADTKVSERWGKKAAARVFHICARGEDVELEDPFAPGRATEKPVRYLARVPGSPERSKTKYDVAQAMSYVATNRNNAEERVSWQSDIPKLLERLATSQRAMAG